MINPLNKEHHAFQGLAHWMNWFGISMPKKSFRSIPTK